MLYFLSRTRNSETKSKKGVFKSYMTQCSVEVGDVTKLSRQMAELVKALEGKPDTLSWVPGTHVVRGENRLL